MSKIFLIFPKNWYFLGNWEDRIPIWEEFSVKFDLIMDLAINQQIYSDFEVKMHNFALVSEANESEIRLLMQKVI